MLIRDTENLDITTKAVFEGGSLNLPSWVPDWTVLSTHRSLNSVLIRTTSAVGDIPPDYDLLNEETLSATGVGLETIDVVGGLCPLNAFCNSSSLNSSDLEIFQNWYLTALKPVSDAIEAELVIGGIKE